MSVNLSLKYGTLANMPVAITNGTISVATDAQKAFVDVSGVRVPISDLVTGNTEAQIRAITAANALNKLYLASDSMKLLYFDTTTYVPEGESEAVAKGWTVVGADHVAKADADGSGNNIASTYETKTDATAKYNQLLSIVDVNRFEIRIGTTVANLPDPGDSNIIWFIPSNPISTDPDSNVYDEYIWVTDTPAVVDPETEEVTTPAVGHYEHIGTTETDLTNYYTKDETDDISDKLWATLGLDEATTDPTATGFQTVSDKIAANAADIDELEAKFGAYAASSAQGFTTVETRFQAVEGEVDEIQAQLGSYAASTATEFVSVEDRFAEIEAEIGTLDSTVTGYVTVADRLDEIEAKFGAYADSTATGFETVEERFAALELDTTQTLGNTNADKPVLISKDNNHDTIEYVPGVTVNASTNTLKVTKLGFGDDALVSYNSTTGALEVDFS